MPYRWSNLYEKFEKVEDCENGWVGIKNSYIYNK
jgi:hypothetical protein